MIKKIETLANVAVIITSVVVCTVLVRRYLWPSANQAMVASIAAPISKAATSSREPAIAPGTKISLPGVNWKQSHSTVVIALSTKCHFCSESAPFYQKLMKEHDPRIRLVAVLPQANSEGVMYLSGLGINIDSVQAQLSSIGVTGTPTLLLVDAQGEVRDSWVGKLADSEQEKVIARINEAVTR